MKGPPEAKDVIYISLMFHVLAVMVAFIILLLGFPVLHFKDCVLRKWKSHTKVIGIFQPWSVRMTDSPGLKSGRNWGQTILDPEEP